MLTYLFFLFPKYLKFNITQDLNLIYVTLIHSFIHLLCVFHVSRVTEIRENQLWLYMLGVRCSKILEERDGALFARVYQAGLDKGILSCSLQWQDFNYLCFLALRGWVQDIPDKVNNRRVKDIEQKMESCVWSQKVDQFN